MSLWLKCRSGSSAASQPVSGEQPPEVGAVEPGEPRGLRDRSRALHEVHEVAALELRGRLPLGFGERFDRGFRCPGRAFADRRVIAAWTTAPSRNDRGD